MEPREKRFEAKGWAESIVQAIRDDDRPFVKDNDIRPITDLKDMLTTSGELYAENIAYLEKFPGDKKFTEISYEQTVSDVNALGTALIARGMKGKRIAIIGENSYHWAVSYLAATCGVGVVVPLDKELSEEELKQQIIRANVSCVCCDKKRMPYFKNILNSGDTPLEMVIKFTLSEKREGIESWKEIVAEGHELMEQGNRDFIDADVIYDDMGIMLFTSGTTGKSKCVMLSHKNICTVLMTSPAIFNLTDKDRYFSILPFHHTYECTMTFLESLYRGSSVAICQGLKYIMKNIEETQPTMVLGVPAIYEKMYNSIWKKADKEGKTSALVRAMKVNDITKNFGTNVNRGLKYIPGSGVKGSIIKNVTDKVGEAFANNANLDLSRTLFSEVHSSFGGKLKTMISGGSAINPEVLDGFRSFGFNAFQGYGLTECAPIASFGPQDAPKTKSVGVALSGTEVKIVNPDEDGIGEICIKGDNVMLGYYEMPEETAQVIDDEGWFHTGDLGYLDDEGYVYISGRQKNVIITKNGKNVYPEEIEYLISKVSFIEESYVFEDSKTSGDDDIIVASVLLDEDEAEKHIGVGYTDEEARELVQRAIDIINETAPSYRKIKRVLLRKTPFIKNSTQKIVRFNEDNKLEI